MGLLDDLENFMNSPKWLRFQIENLEDQIKEYRRPNVFGKVNMRRLAELERELEELNERLAEVETTRDGPRLDAKLSTLKREEKAALQFARTDDEREQIEATFAKKRMAVIREHIGDD